MKSDKSGEVQYAALPWRIRDGVVEILLLTSRETRRWVIPKGWPMIGLSPAETAVQEAKEEAGVEGRVSEAIGLYPYTKWMKDGSSRLLNVEVYPLEVTVENETWLEADERSRQWFAGAEASELVDESELGALIGDFSARSAPPRT